MAVAISDLQVVSTAQGRQAKFKLAFDTSYPTGGEPLAPSAIGLSQIGNFDVAGQELGYLFDYDYTNLKLKVRTGGLSGFTPAGTIAVTPHADSAGTPAQATGATAAFSGNTAPALLRVDNVINVVTDVGTFPQSPSYILSVEVTAGGVTGPFAVIPSGATPITTQVAVDFNTKTLTFAAADAVTQCRVTFLTARIGTTFELTSFVIDEDVVAAAAGVNLAQRASLVQYVYDTTAGTILTPTVRGEAPGAAEYDLDINNAGQTTILTNAGIDGNHLAVTYHRFDKLPSGSMFVDDADVALYNQYVKMSTIGQAVGVTNAASSVTAAYLPDYTPVIAPTIALTHAADPTDAGNDGPLFITEALAGAYENCGVLQSVCNAAANVLGETADGSVYGVAGSARFWVTHNAAPTGVQVYVNEGAADQLECVSPTGKNVNLILPMENAAGIGTAFIKVVVHHNAAAATGKPLYFNDDGLADAQLVFTDAGAAGGIVPPADVVAAFCGSCVGTAGSNGSAAAQATTVTENYQNFDGLVIPGHGTWCVGEDGVAGNHAALFVGPNGTAANGVARLLPANNQIQTAETTPLVTTAMSWLVIPQSLINDPTPSGGVNVTQATYSALGTHTHASTAAFTGTPVTATTASEVANGTNLSVAGLTAVECIVDGL